MNTLKMGINETQRSINSSVDTSHINQEIRKAVNIWDQHQDSVKFLLLSAAKQGLDQAYTEGTTEAFTLLGQKFLEEGSYDSCWFFLKHGLYHSSRLRPNYDYTARIYAHMAAAKYARSQFHTAAIYMYKALSSLEPNQSRNHKNTYRVYRIVGAIWANLGNLENATPYLNQAEKIAQIHNDQSLAADVLCTKGTIYSKRGSLDSAFACYKKVLELPSPTAKWLADANYFLGTNLLMRAKISDSRLDVRAALKYLSEALRLEQELKREQRILKIKSHLAVGHISLGDHATGEKILLEVLNKDSEIGLDIEIIKTNRNLAGAYYYGKKYKMAFDQLLRTLELKDSILKKENIEMVAGLEVKYQVAQKDRLLAEKQLQITQQQNQIKERNIWIGVIATGGILLSALLLSLFWSHKRKEEIARLKSMMQGEEKERTRIAHELHDGIISELSAVKMHFSAIEYQIKEHVAAGDFKEAMTQLEYTTEELRKTSHNLMPEVLIHSGIGIAVHSFCEKLRKSSSINIDFQAYGDIPRINLEFELTVYRIIQELVQNTLKHAQASYILVQLSYQDQLFTIAVEDNGNGIPEITTGDGMGLNNIKTRVKALDGQINIASDSAGTSIYLEFNISNYQ